MGQVTEHVLRKYPESSEVRMVEEAEPAAGKDSDRDDAGDPVGEFEALLDRQGKAGH